MTEALPQTIDPVALAQGLIQCPSVTPDEGGALALLEQVLTRVGFEVHRVTFTEDGYDTVNSTIEALPDIKPMGS